jgi:arylsulfatase A-like enzyme
MEIEMVKKTTLLGIAVLLAAIGCFNPVQAAEEPNVVIFFMDDLDFSGMGAGYDLMKVSSSERLAGGEPEFPVIVTPNTDRLVEQALVFDQFYITSPVCSPSRFSLLTGKYASTAYNLKNDFAPGQSVHLIDWSPHVKPGQYNLSKMFKSAGYRTGIVGKLHCEDGYYNMAKLYKKYTNQNPLSAEAMAELADGYRDFVGEIEELYACDYADRIYFDNAESRYFPKPLKAFNLDWCTEGALDFIEESKDEPFFLYFSVNYPHGVSGAGVARFSEEARRKTPLGMLDKIPGVLPDVETARQQIRDAGGNPNETDSLTMVDHALGAIEQKLRETGNVENTIFVYLSDHQKLAKNNPHGSAHVPCVIRWPKKMEGQSRTDALCANIDLLPTLAEIVDAKIPADVKLDGKSFAPLLSGDSDFQGHDSILLEINYSRALIQGDYKYIEYFAPTKVRDAVTSGKTEIYKKTKKERRVGWHGMRYDADMFYPNYFDPVQLVNLEKDPFERINLADNPEYAPVANKMREKLVAEVERLKVEQSKQRESQE